MYKITVYNQNCSSICDGTTFWFVEDLKEFEKKWLPLQSIIVDKSKHFATIGRQ